MTEMTSKFALELVEVRRNFNTMAEIIRNGGVHRAVHRVLPMSTTVRDEFNLRIWYATTMTIEFHRLDSHSWHAALQSKYNLHKAVDKCMLLARPADWHQLLLEWPHVSDTDPSRLAYTRDDRGGQDNRQVITTIGKYITRHFPTLAAHHVRDITALFAADQCKLVHTTAEMIYHLGRGPKSCMQWGDMDIASHPYACYDPRLGWSMAIREEGGDTVARALVYKSPDTGASYFVRSYTKHDSFSHSDTILEAWLNAQGIPKRSDWDGAKLTRVTTGRSDLLVFPYIDGDIKRVDVYDDYMCITEYGEYMCDNTDGTADDDKRQSCEDCGEYANEDDGYWVGIDGDTWVCDTCCRDDYTYVYGRRGARYHVHNNDVVEVGGEYYHDEYITDNNIVHLEDGNHCDLDDAVYVESQDGYYHCDDDDVCYDDHNNCYELRDRCVELKDGTMCHQDNAWQCEHSDDWYHEDEDSVDTTCGMTIHPDYADQYEVEDDTTVEETTVTLIGE